MGVVVMTIPIFILNRDVKTTMVLCIYGASGLGKEFCYSADAINSVEKRWDDIVFVDDTPEKSGMFFEGKITYSFDEVLKKYEKSNLEFLIAIGEPSTKDLIYNKLKKNDLSVTNMYPVGVVLPESATVGEGVVIQSPSGSGTSVGSVLGNNVLIQGNVVLGHDIVVGDNSVISSLAFIGGNTVIGRNTYIAPHACLRNGITIGDNCVIGMGSVVTKDIPANSVAYGSPARVVRTVEGENKVFG